MKIRLVDIPGVSSEHQVQKVAVKALEINGRSPALDELTKWSESSQNDYKKIIAALRQVANQSKAELQKRVRSQNRVKFIKKYGIYEARAHRGNARLMFFYAQADDAIVVCTNHYWKTKGSRKEQEQSFKTCCELKRLYESTRKKGG